MIGLAGERTGAPRAAWRNRALSALCVGGYLTAAGVFVPDASLRSELHYALVITIGYGHLVGAAIFSSDRIGAAIRSAATPAWLRSGRAVLTPIVWALALLASTLLFGAYVRALVHTPEIVLMLLAISTWHTVENDQALTSIYARERRTGPLPRAVDPHLSALGVTALVLAVAAASLGEADPASLIVASSAASEWVATRLTLPARTLAAVCGGVLILRATSRSATLGGTSIVISSALIPTDLTHLAWLSFSDVFAATSLYHLASWLWLSVGRLRDQRRRGAMVTLAFIHLLPAALCVGLLCMREGTAVGPFAAAYFSPAIYLYWSILHVGQSLLVRELPPGSAHQSAKAPSGRGNGSSSGSKRHQRQYTAPGE
ncbi:MAG: hypothetical protein JRE70_05350 [Deltaproteobacteria bacterium]|nr:hypothetical protein [Deltaproteobacteria bacterium]